MGSVTFTIKGLAACYRKRDDPFWTIVFPTDEHHKVKFSYVKNGTKEEVDDLKDKSITISSRAPDDATGTEPPAAYEDASFTKFAIDLTADYLHSDGLIKRPPQDMENSGITTGTRKLEIPHATLFSEEERPERLNYVFDFETPDIIRLIPDTADAKKPQIFSKLVGGEINLKPGAEIIIKIQDKPEIHLFARDSFHIDNDCKSSSVQNDFQLYQDIFANKVKTEKRFEMISVLNPKFPMPSDEQEKLALVTNPPPIICDTVRISKPDDIESI